ncbi:hypothetical protein LCGC14_2149610 [marine sediment metagenome]|uniref:Uncharacterized protein n=1 Tax=marine sediment metagenome TaxID=412755 RepID=A0A0F9GS83_9ZZZZ
MFIISIPKDFNKVDGKPFRKIKEDREGKVVRATDEKDNLIPPSKDAEGNDSFQYETVSATYLDMLSSFLNSIFDVVAMKAREDKENKEIKPEDRTKPLELEDSSYATDIFRAIHVSNETLELEKHPHEWLVKLLTNYGVASFGINAATILEPVKNAVQQDPTRAERKRNEDKKTIK